MCSTGRCYLHDHGERVLKRFELYKRNTMSELQQRNVVSMPDVRRTQGSFVQCLTIALVTMVTRRSCSMVRAALTCPGGMPSNMSPPAPCTNIHHHQPTRSATLLQTSSDTLEQDVCQAKNQCMHGMLYNYHLNLTGHRYFGRLEAMSTREDKHQTCITLQFWPSSRIVNSIHNIRCRTTHK